MALRAAAYASLPLALLGTDTAPGCGCTVSHCCTAAPAYNNSEDLSDSLAHLFNASRYDFYDRWMIGILRNGSGYSAACSLLHLVPGIFDQDSGGACSDLAFSMGDTTVCEAINASAEERETLSAERPCGGEGQRRCEPFSVLSFFLEPGTCAELQDGACWESREGNASYGWDGAETTWGADQALVGDARLQWSATCQQHKVLPSGWRVGVGGLKVQAKWLDYSYGVEATLGPDDWLGGGVGGLPRWQCFDVPGGPSAGDTAQDGPPGFDVPDYRYLIYSVGELPCNGGNGEAESESESPLSSGSSGTSFAALAHAVAAAAVAGASA